MLTAPGAADLADLSEGDTVQGTVKKVEHFGVFVRLNGSSLTGLAHKSELADAFVADTAAAFQVGQGKGRPPVIPLTFVVHNLACCTCHGQVPTCSRTWLPHVIATTCNMIMPRDISPLRNVLKCGLLNA